MINDDEFTNAVRYLLDKKIIDIDIPTHPGTQIGEITSSTKHLFKMWTDDKLSELIIIKTIHQYRVLGVW